MYQTWNTPDITYSRLYADMLQQIHILIAGSTGSGKSTVINGMIHAALKDSPARVGFILIDPKRVELAPYANLPHTIAHAKGFDPKAWTAALMQAVSIMDARYAEMERKRQKMYDGSDIYVIIDEWANVYKNGGAACYRAVMRLTSEGRAARVHVILATQVPKANVIPTEIRENFTARLCLRCNTKAESRVLMDVAGCENLPQYGFGYYITPRGKDLYTLPMVEETELQRVIDHWMSTRPCRHLFRRAG
jgi:S-DNA-T family DNA segregation ATPase FtsK/SpoIIIE